MSDSSDESEGRWVPMRVARFPGTFEKEDPDKRKLIDSTGLYRGRQTDFINYADEVVHSWRHWDKNEQAYTSTTYECQDNLDFKTLKISKILSGDIWHACANSHYNIEDVYVEVIFGDKRKLHGSLANLNKFLDHIGGLPIHVIATDIRLQFQTEQYCQTTQVIMSCIHDRLCCELMCYIMSEKPISLKMFNGINFIIYCMQVYVQKFHHPTGELQEHLYTFEIDLAIDYHEEQYNNFCVRTLGTGSSYESNIWDKYDQISLQDIFDQMKKYNFEDLFTKHQELARLMFQSIFKYTKITKNQFEVDVIYQIVYFATGLTPNLYQTNFCQKQFLLNKNLI